MILPRLYFTGHQIFIYGPSDLKCRRLRAQLGKVVKMITTIFPALIRIPLRLVGLRQRASGIDLRHQRPDTPIRTPGLTRENINRINIVTRVHCFNPSTMSTNPEVLRFTAAMTNYYVLFETCCQCVRTLPNMSQLYKEAVEKWQHRSEFYWPSFRGDKAALERFFSAVDKACQNESREPENVLNLLQWPFSTVQLLSHHLCMFGCDACGH